MSTANVGTFTISIDLELGWGRCDRPMRRGARRDIELEREIIQRLLELFSKYDVRATWAIVGHLMLNECAWEGETVHPEIRRPISRYGAADWFYQHPDTPNDDIWYGRDIVGWIRNASPKQQIGSHSFSHLIYDEDATHREAIDSDIERARQVHAEEGLPFEAFIFPRNAVGAMDSLARAGITVYRGNTRRWYHAVKPRSLRRLSTLLSYFLRLPPPTVTAKIDGNGMVNVPDSMLLLGQGSIRRLVPPKSLASMGISGLNRAVNRNEIFHLWFHPSNFAHNTENQFQVMEAILGHALSLRENGVLRNLTMGDIQKESVGASLPLRAS